MIRAVNDDVIVKAEYDEKSGLIYIPDQAKIESGEFYGEVISIGPEYPFRNEIKVGDRVVFTRHEGMEDLLEVEIPQRTSNNRRL